MTAKNHECDHQTNCAGAAFSDTPLEILHAALISGYEKELVQTDPVHVCCSCEQLHKRRNVSQVSFSDTELGTDVWPRLKAFILERDETASKQVLFICNYCKQSIKIDKMPPRCVLNPFTDTCKNRGWSCVGCHFWWLIQMYLRLLGSFRLTCCLPNHCVSLVHARTCLVKLPRSFWGRYTYCSGCT